MASSVRSATNFQMSLREAYILDTEIGTVFPTPTEYKRWASYVMLSGYWKLLLIKDFNSWNSNSNYYSYLLFCQV